MLQKELELSTGVVQEEYLQELLNGVLSCVKDNNYKVSLGAMDCLKIILQENGDYMKMHAHQLTERLIERLGDNKIPVRDLAVELLFLLMKALGVTSVLERLHAETNHKNHNTRCASLKCVQKAIDSLIVADGELKKWASPAIHLLDDSHKDVREEAMNLLEVLYRHFGQSFLTHIQSKNMRSSHTKQLMSRVEGILPMKTAAAPVVSAAATVSVRARTKPKAPTKTRTSLKKTSSQSIQSDQQVLKEIGSIRDGLSNAKDWSARMSALQRLGDIASAAAQFPSFLPELRSIRDLVCEQVTSLRSSIVRVACTTIVELANVLRDEFDVFAKYLIRPLLKLTMNSTQVMSSSGDECIRTILNYTTVGYQGVVQTLLQGIKNRTQRSYCVDYLSIVYDRWDIQQLERYSAPIAAAFPSLLQDAQVSVRTSARSFYRVFITKFPHLRSDILASIDATTQRHLCDSSDQVHPLLHNSLPPVVPVRVAEPVVEVEQHQPLHQKVQRINVGGFPTIKESKDLSKSVPRRIMRKEPPKQLSVARLIESAEDSLWSTRVETFNSLGELCRTNPSECYAHSEKLIRCFETHLSDSHFKVVDIVLQHFPHMCASVKMADLAHRLVPIWILLFTKNQDPKTQRAANESIQMIQSVFDASSLLTTLWPRIESIPAKVKSNAVQMIYELIPSATGYFGNPSHMRQFIVKCAQWVNDTSSVVWAEVGQQCLVLVYHSYETQLHATLNLLSASLCLDLVMILQRYIPEFEQHSCTVDCHEIIPSNQEEEDDPAIEEEPVEEEDEIQELIQTLTPSHSQHDRNAALTRLIDQLSSVREDQWRQWYATLLFRLLDELARQNPKAVEVLTVLLQEAPSSYSNEFLGPMIDRILNDGCVSTVDLFRHMCSSLLLNEVIMISPLPSLPYIITYIAPSNTMRDNDANIRCLDIGVELLAMAISSITSQMALNRYIHPIMKAVVPLMRHSDVVVRRNAVKCIVSLYWGANKEIVNTYLQKMDLMTRKLILMYIHKDSNNQIGATL